MKSFYSFALFTAFLLSSNSAVCIEQNAQPIQHVLMISIDGMHALDLNNYIAIHKESALAKLAKSGIVYTSAHTPAPADSFPGLLALITGGTPSVTGVYFDETYDRALSPPGSDCSRTGSEVIYDSSVDKMKNGHIEPKLDPDKLPRDPSRNCQPVYPHSYLRVNTIFDVAKQAGGYTAWIDKHPVYEIVQGPNGNGVSDLYTPEIGENYEGRLDRNKGKIMQSLFSTERYDADKVDAVIHEIDGRTHDNFSNAPVPTIFGLNLQVVNVGEKLAGFLNEQGLPKHKLEIAFDDVDHELGRIVSALERNNLRDSTLIVITAKHGNGPIDSKRVRHVDNAVLRSLVSKAAQGSLAKMTQDQVVLIWLKNPENVKSTADRLELSRQRLSISRILYGRSLSLYFPSSTDDSRSPDIVLVPKYGVIYAENGDEKVAEHGGFDDDATHVPLMISNPFLHAGVVRVPVTTTEVAPTILSSLGLDSEKLWAVRKEGTPMLPGEKWNELSGVH